MSKLTMADHLRVGKLHSEEIFIQQWQPLFSSGTKRSLWRALNERCRCWRELNCERRRYSSCNFLITKQNHPRCTTPLCKHNGLSYKSADVSVSGSAGRSRQQLTIGGKTNQWAKFPGKGTVSTMTGLPMAREVNRDQFGS